jgi:hypothetical protein
MTKSEAREVAKLDAVSKWAQPDIGYLARGYSALVRAARKQSSKNEITVHAAARPAVVQHPEFIV